MNTLLLRVWLSCSALLLAVGQAGLAQPSADKAPVVPVAHPVERVVIDFQDFTGRTQAVHQVDVRARVTGYLVKVLFKEGAEVKKGDLLFEIDPRPYRAQLDQAQSRLALDEASLKLAKVTFERDRALSATTPGSISRGQLDQDRAAVEEAEARVAAAKAAAQVYKLNLEWTRVPAPFDGRIGHRRLDPGNLVQADTTLLATLVSEDPIEAAFDMDERTLLRLRRAVNEGKIKALTELPARLGLADEEGHPHRGTLNVIDNRVNPETGTIPMRAVFANPKLPGGVRLLSPGMFVRVHLMTGEPYKALLVAQRAIASDQGRKFIYVIDADNKVQRRTVETGPLQADALQVVSAGLKPDDLVVVGELPGLRPLMTVKPEKTTMPVQPSHPGEKRP